MPLLPFSAAAGSTPNATLTTRGKDLQLVYNVVNYGAKGDGTTDDTTAIQNTINAANAAGGGIVFFPKGNYKLTATLTCYAYIWYLGATSNFNNNGGACLNQTVANIDALQFVNTTNKTSNVVISNLRIQGIGATTGNGIYLKNTGNAGVYPPFIYFSVRDVYIAGFNGTGACGVNMEGSIVSVLERVVSETCNTGFYLNGGVAGNWTNTVTSITMNACYADGCQAGTGFKLKNVIYTTLNNCAADSCGTAYIIDTCNVVHLSGCGSEWSASDTSTPGDGYKITGCNQVTLTSCYTFKNFHYSFWLTGNSAGITLVGAQENSPATAVNSLKVDLGSHGTVINGNFTTAQSLALGSTNILDDTTGAMTTGKHRIVGTLDTVQLDVLSNSGQSAYIQQWSNSSDGLKAAIKPNGDFYTNGSAPLGFSAQSATGRGGTLNIYHEYGTQTLSFYSTDGTGAMNIKLGDGTLSLAGTGSNIAQYKSVGTVGWGVPAIYGLGRLTAQTAAVASVATYTVGAADGSFIISANVNVTTSTTHSFTVTVTYTDEGGTSRVLTLNFSQLTGALITAITNVTGAAPYEGIPTHIRCKAATAITIATTGTFTAVTYNVEGIITQIA